LVSGVLSALADMQPLPPSKRIVVDRSCRHVSGTPVKEIKEWIEAYQQDGHKLSLEMRFIGGSVGRGLGTSSRDHRHGGGQAYFANTAAELNDVLEYVLEFQPAVIHVKTANIEFMTGVPQ
jgi:hypothetical protein